MFGRLILSQNVSRNLNKADISSFENGMYVYKIVGVNDVLGSGKKLIVILFTKWNLNI